MRLQEQGGRHLVDGRAPSGAAHAARDHGALGQSRREAFVDELDRQAGRLAKGGREVARGTSRVPPGSVELKGEPDDDALGLVAAGRLSEPFGERVERLGIESPERLGDGRGRIADRQADAPGSGVDREHAAYGLCDGDGDGVADPWEAADADGEFDAMTYCSVMRRSSSGINGKASGSSLIATDRMGSFSR